SISPLPTVFATAVVRNAPARFIPAASSTATLGERARVEIAVAIEFAVSWKPFVKSNGSATTTTMTSNVVLTPHPPARTGGTTRPAENAPAFSAIFDDDRFAHVGRVLAR